MLNFTDESATGSVTGSIAIMAKYVLYFTGFTANVALGIATVREGMFGFSDKAADLVVAYRVTNVVINVRSVCSDKATTQITVDITIVIINVSDSACSATFVTVGITAVVVLVICYGSCVPTSCCVTNGIASVIELMCYCTNKTATQITVGVTIVVINVDDNALFTADVTIIIAVVVIFVAVRPSGKELDILGYGHFREIPHAAVFECPCNKLKVFLYRNCRFGDKGVELYLLRTNGVSAHCVKAYDEGLVTISPERDTDQQGDCQDDGECDKNSTSFAYRFAYIVDISCSFCPFLIRQIFFHVFFRILFGISGCLVG